ncbi:hypothetical protein MJT46_009217 [Ovis ammon polii x Ovis aries]|nr:hypothetical protein MJT46_009217 [Ovis ammon polii x Ovis aries]
MYCSRLDLKVGDQLRQGSGDKLHEVLYLGPISSYTHCENCVDFVKLWTIINDESDNLIHSSDFCPRAAVSSSYIFKPCGTGVGERKAFSEEFALELCPRKRPEISHRKIPGNSISDRESSKFKNFKWPREIVEGNWVSWEKYIVTFWAKSGRAVRQSPVRAHRVRYGSWLRSQAAD